MRSVYYELFHNEPLTQFRSQQFSPESDFFGRPAKMNKFLTPVVLIGALNFLRGGKSISFFLWHNFSFVVDISVQITIDQVPMQIDQVSWV